MRGENVQVGLAMLAITAAGCGYSSRDEQSAVREILRERTELQLVERDPEAYDRDDPAIGEILARPLTAESAVRIALLNNRRLRESLYEVGIARGEMIQAGLLPNPTIDAQARFPESGEQGVQYELGAVINLTQLILAPMRAHAASARVDAARYRAAGATLDAAYRTRVAFYRYQASTQQLELMRTAAESFAAGVAAARAIRDAGTTRDLDVAIEEAAWEEMRIEVARAELHMLDDRERLNVLMGLYGRDVGWEIDGRMAAPPSEPLALENLETDAIEASLELAWTRAELETLGRLAGVARAEGLIPDIEGGIHAEYDGDRWEIGPEMTIGLPIFSQGQGTVIQREAELEALRERYVGLAIAVRASVRAARNRAVATELLARRYREVLLPARERVFEQTLLQYNAMQLDVFRLLQARREQIQAATEYIETLREYWEARATLDQVLSGRLAGTIDRYDIGEDDEDEREPLSISGERAESVQ